MKKTLLLSALLCLALSVCAQGNRPIYSQNPACPGLKNPSNFTVAGGTANAIWYGYTGSKNAQASTCTVSGSTWGSRIEAANLESTQSTSGCGSCGSETTPSYQTASKNIDNQNDWQKQFVIKGPGYDVETHGHLTYQPPDDTSYHTSIRLGNYCGQHGAEKIYYEFMMNSDNALITIWYAMSLQNGQHVTAQNPEIVITVEKQLPNGTWTLAMGDTLCYTRATPASGNGGNIAPFYCGATNQQTYSGSGNIYLPWNKVLINLSKLQYQRVRIMMSAGDCSQSVHYACCYLAGDCQSMTLRPIGCAAGESDSVARIYAPTGAQQYRWYRSKTGELMGNEQQNMDNYILIEGATQSSLGATLAQFRNVNTNEVMPKNTFCCEMTTKMNETMPVVSRLFATTGNTKPTLIVDSMLGCNANISLIDKSVTPYSPRAEDMVDTSHTVWKFYSSANPSPATLVGTVTGGTASHTFDNPGNYCVTVRTQTFDTTCWNEKTVKIRTIKNPVPQVNIQRNNLCKGDTISLTDMTANSRSTYHHWQIGDSSFTSASLGIRYTFDKTTDVTLTTRGTEYYMADTTGDGITERVYCYSDTTFRIFVGNYPGPKVVGDTIVCNGNQSDIHVEDTVENCRYDWYQVYGGTIPYLENSNTLQTTITQDRSFYVKATSPFECISWDSVNLYLVKPDLTASRTRICTDDTVLLTAGRAAYFEWLSNPVDPDLAVQSTSPEIVVSPKVTTVYTVTGHGTNGCSATPLTKKIEVFPYPVLNIRLTPDYIDSENPSVQFSDLSQYGTTSLWNFGNGETSTFRTVVHTFSDLSEDSLLISLVTGNALGCTSDTSFYVPVGIFAVWFPNAFTPKLETNRIFQAFTANDILDFELYIYDRNGSLVFQSRNIEVGWDGTYHGYDCKEGTYVYIAKYRRKGVDRLMTQKGTVNLLR